MAFLKCELGKPLILAVDDVAYNVKGKFGVQTVFHAGDDSFAMNPESAAKQLEFAQIADPIGLTLEFSKVDIGKGRTAINIKEVSGTPPKAPPSRQDAPRPTNTPQGGEFDSPTYRLITAWVLAEIAPLYANRAGGGVPDAQAIASMVATLYIQSNKH